MRTRLTLNDLISEYQKIRKEYGDKAKSVTWMDNNGHSWLTQQMYKKKLRWKEFKKRAGFNNNSNYRYRTQSIPCLISKYQKIRKEHGDKAKNSNWLKRNNYGWLYSQIKTHEFIWHKFKKLAGFDDKRVLSLDEYITEYQKIRKIHGNKAATVKWLWNNGYAWSPQKIREKYGLLWKEFKQKAGFNDSHLMQFTIDKLISEYQKIRKKHGDRAKSSRWMRRKDNYSGLFYQIRKGGRPWKVFKKLAGFEDDKPLNIPLEKIILKYKEIRKEHGNKAKKAKWIKSNGYQWLHSLLKKYDLSWHQFKVKAGFIDKRKNLLKDKHGLLLKDQPLEKLILEYQKIRKIYGDKSSNITWIRKRYSWVYYGAKANNLKWSEFKIKAGYNDKIYHRKYSQNQLIAEYQKIRKEHGDKAKSCGWILDNGHCWLYGYIQRLNLGWVEFKKLAGFNDEHPKSRIHSLKDLITEYQKIRKKHGNKAKRTKWVSKNGYSWLIDRVQKHKLLWHEFKTLAGFNDAFCNQNVKHKKIRESLRYQGFSDPTIRKIIKAIENGQ